MAIPMSPECLLCNFKKNMAVAQPLGTDAQAMDFAKALMEIYIGAPKEATSPYLGPQVADLLHEMYGLDIDRFHQE